MSMLKWSNMAPEQVTLKMIACGIKEGCLSPLSNESLVLLDPSRGIKSEDLNSHKVFGVYAIDLGDDMVCVYKLNGAVEMNNLFYFGINSRDLSDSMREEMSVVAELNFDSNTGMYLKKDSVATKTMQ